MLSDDIILLFHIILFYIFALSPLITDCYIKKLILILMMFLSLQYVSKYGKCGLINVERFFIEKVLKKKNFKEGFIYRLIKPLVCYKQNVIYQNSFSLIIIYMVILYIQLEKAGCDLNIFEDFKKIYQDIRKV
jgi:hypothetical protein